MYESVDWSAISKGGCTARERALLPVFMCISYWAPALTTSGRIVGVDQPCTTGLLRAAMLALSEDHPLRVIHAEWPRRQSFYRIGRYRRPGTMALVDQVRSGEAGMARLREIEEYFGMEFNYDYLAPAQADEQARHRRLSPPPVFPPSSFDQAISTCKSVS